MEKDRTPTEALSWRTSSHKLAASDNERMMRKLMALENMLQRGLHAVRELQSEVHAMDQPNIYTADYMVSMMRGTGLYTPGGSVRGIREKIREVLSVRGDPMTSAQIAEALYIPDPKVSFDLFKRRVIVAASSMYKDSKPSQLVPADRKGAGREVFWTLPEEEDTIREKPGANRAFQDPPGDGPGSFTYPSTDEGAGSKKANRQEEGPKEVPS